MTSRTAPARPPAPTHPGHRDRRRHRVVLVALAVVSSVVVTLAVVALTDAGSPAVDRLRTAVPTLSGASSAGDGRVGDERLTPDDVDHPTLANLDPALLAALQAAADDAADDGVEVLVTSGWRSREYQRHLFDEAVRTYGSEGEAERWVARPDASRHVTGDAVDVGATDAAYWMAEHGADHGLCQVFANEIWHYELLVEPGGTCPPMHQDGSS